MSKITIIFFTTVFRSLLVEASEVNWSIDGICNEERQPTVEYFDLNGKQYLLFSQRVTWEEAHMLCQSYDSRLAVLNDIEKATGVAEALAESDIKLEESWIGARRLDNIWTWLDSQDNAWRKNILSLDVDVDNYPPWTREPTRPTKECLALDRRSHSYPNFIDLDCRLPRSYICEKKPEEDLKSPVLSKRVQIHKSTYTLYHGRVTWNEAASFCRKQGTRLAILKNPSVIEILSNSMTKTRPDFETVWIGAHFSYGEWVWIATGAILNSVAENEYPPWKSGRSEKNEGCLILDRHLEGSLKFIETSCDRKRDFICEHYPPDEQDDWLNDPVKFSHDYDTYIIYSEEKTWQESYDFCHDRGSNLAYMEDMNTTHLIIEAMGDHPRGMRHLWIGGRYNSNLNQWRWIHNNEVIPSVNDSSGFPPWANIEGHFEFYNEALMCLNLDRSDHVKAHLYGLDCNHKQPFICKINCNTPPEVENGNWNCYQELTGNQCSMDCEPGFIMMGLQNATCSNQEGWTSANNWLEFPVCLESSEYADRLVRSLGNEIQNIVGYYLILDHWNENIKRLSIQFSEQLLSIFPINHNLKMGMASYITGSHLFFNQTDNCATLSAIRAMENKISASDSSHDNSTDNWIEDISKYIGRKTLIVAIVDRNHAKRHGEALQQFIATGHHVVVIGLREDWETLLPLSTVGLDRKINLFLFDGKEFEIVVTELHKIRRKIGIKCSENIKLPSKSESTIHTEHKPLNNSDIFSNTSSSTSNYPTLHPGSISKNKTTILTESTVEAAITESTSIENTTEIRGETHKQNDSTLEEFQSTVSSDATHTGSKPYDLINSINLNTEHSTIDPLETNPRIYQNLHNK